MRIKELRENKNESQTELGKKLGLTKGQMLRLENENSHNKTITTLIKLADYFDVSLDFLLNRTWCNQIGYIPEDKKELVKEIIELETNDVKEVQAFINGLKAGKSQNTNFKVFN